MDTKEIAESEVVEMPMELSVFDPLDAKIAKAKAKNEILAFDYHDKQGNKEARSWVAGLRRLKKPVEEMGKTGMAAAVAYCDEWRENTKRRITTIEEMIEYHYAPIKAIEDAEAVAEKAEVDRIVEERIKAETERLAEVEAREKAVAEIEAMLKVEEEKRAEKDRQTAIVEAARKEAREEAEQVLIDTEKRRIATIVKAEQALKDAENRRIADVQRAKDEATAEAQEKERIAREKKAAEEMAETERINDKAHRRAVNKEIYECLSCYFEDETAKQMFHLLHAGTVPYTSINY